MKDTDNKAPRVLISGGGTGGHIFPALSIAAAIRRRHPEAEILFVGAEDRMEMERVPAAGYRIEGLPVAGFDRHRLWRNFGVLVKLFRSMLKARRIVREFRPDIAIGVGGYASGPTLKAAQRAGVPTLLQEQNSYAGVTNKLLARKARRICTAYEGMERFFPAEVITLTGNPVRKELLDCPLSAAEAKKALGFDPERPLVLVVGGSLGARTLNSAMSEAVRSGAVAKADFSIYWQTGKAYAAECLKTAGEADCPNLKAGAFIADMATAYAAADLVVARAGAGTISELELLGKGAILVPSPNVAEDHQRHNAEALSTRGAAVMIPDAEAAARLWPEIVRLADDAQALSALSANILKMALTAADEKIADAVDLIINSER